MAAWTPDDLSARDPGETVRETLSGAMSKTATWRYREGMVRAAAVYKKRKDVDLHIG